MSLLEVQLDKCILIIDECHNVISTSTEVNSEQITPHSLDLCLGDLTTAEAPEEIKEFVKKLREKLYKIKKKHKKKLNQDKPQLEIPLAPQAYLSKLYKLAKVRDLPQFKQVILFLEGLSLILDQIYEDRRIVAQNHIKPFVQFLSKWIEKREKEAYFFCYRISLNLKTEKKYVSLEINALDPRDISLPIIKQAHSCISLSGTIEPVIYENLMGFNQCVREFKVEKVSSPFKPQNFKGYVFKEITTKKKERTKYMYRKIINQIEEVSKFIPQNIGIFCASYKVLKGLKVYGIKKLEKSIGKKLFIEEQGSNSSENALMLEDFKSMGKPPNKGAILLGVSGGRNSEGEDFRGNMMNAVFVVGLPYSALTPLISAKISYYNTRFDYQGWNYAYLFPAMLRANQASGRPLRSEEDKAVIGLMDYRFWENKGWICDWLSKYLAQYPNDKAMLKREMERLWNQS